MKEAAPQTIYLKDYQPLPYKIEEIHLTFDLHSTQTQVTSRMKVTKNPESKEVAPKLELNGEELKFISAEVNGKKLEESDYDLSEEGLVIKDLPESFELVIVNEINPEANKALDGLYKSGSIFCTQNEPEGFRRITYYLDRPDNMAKFTTKIIADKEQYPVLLSNGNPIAEGDLENGKHFVEWEDPFVKPSYLYALVAGDLGLVQDSYTTMSGRKIDLRIYCDKGNESKCDHAMESLKKSMKWDEDTFGLEYDLDIYMIVAVDAFNMGAMENKGLNIFNSVYVLADEKTATDGNFLGIESVVGHEYFHNWTGNRITCRDWFQLTLKEGLTVYRDQEFSSDLNSRTVQRIQDVERLKTFQFVEDAGPTAHPIKPSSYMEINNFYTATIYEKGAEVIRMVRTLLGKDGFRKGMDKYFELFDGQAVTTEDFLHSMSVANGNYDFSQFKNWYNQAGTPVVKASWSYDQSKKTLTLKTSQSCRSTAEASSENKLPYFFPFGVGLIKANGQDMALELENSDNQSQIKDGIIHITKAEEEFVFVNVEEEPVVSLNRGFTAPIKLEAPYELKDYFFLMANDSNLYNRYEALQSAVYLLVKKMDQEFKEGKEVELDKSFIEAYGKLLKDKSLDPAIKAMLISIPSTTLLQQGHNPVSFERILKARKTVVRTLAGAFEEVYAEIYKENETSGAYSLDPLSVGKRSLRTTCLGFLGALGEKGKFVDLIKAHFSNATNMTDEIGGLQVLSKVGGEPFKEASDKFYKKWAHETLVMQKWLTVQGGISDDSTLSRIEELESDAIYNKTVPNLVRSLIGAFSRNLEQLHHPTGRGYKFMADKVLEMDKINPQVASRLASAFKDFKRLEGEQKSLMEKELKRIIEADGLSKNVYEITSKTLNS
tara:strand:+ start:81277 stop:83937 length:2661 start_codon:yes stop_codon:yes gene_type:complete